MALFGTKKTAKKTSKLTVVKDETPIVYDLNEEVEGCRQALTQLVGEQATAEGFNFIKKQCETDPQFVQMIFDRQRREQLLGLMSGFNPAQLLGGIAEKFVGIL
ncbi:hypothetical protein [Runella sp.]|uniref:hypothetical protein n=1 Tax=Runella sp. TaxID=1960881 RepID=UPI003D142912